MLFLGHFSFSYESKIASKKAPEPWHGHFTAVAEAKDVSGAMRKFEALIEEIVERTAEGRPVLVGTVSVEKSEVLAEMLKRRGIKHEVLNAKQHEKEAPIVAQAGRAGAVTIATNMAGRGTDILLGGNPAGLASEMLHRKGLNPIEVDRAVYDATLAEARSIWISMWMP